MTLFGWCRTAPEENTELRTFKAEASMPKPTLYYFDAAGRGEATRLAFVAGGIDFVDKRMSPADFAQLKPSSPSGQVPLLEINGIKYVQSRAFVKYACRLTYPEAKDPLAELGSDMVVDAIEALFPPAIAVIFATDETRADAKQNAQEKWTATLALLNDLVGKYQQEEGHMIRGQKFCPADLSVFSWMRQFNNKSFGIDLGNLKAQFPHLWGMYEAVWRDNKKIQEYYEHKM